jgi:phosphoglycolate phosphatase-like HAD superfamily hydrolase
MNMASPSKGFIRSKIGLAATELFVDLDLDDYQLSEAVSLFRSHLADIKLQPSDLFPSVLETLDALKKMSFSLAVATNKPSNLASLSFSQTGIVDYFEFIAGGDKCPPKPNPEVIFKCLEFLKSVPTESIMIGDRAEDMQAAKNAGVFAVGLAQGPHSEKLLREKGANFTYQSMSDFIHSVKKGELIENIQ